MTEQKFNEYRKLCAKIAHLFCEHNLNSIGDIELTYNIIRGYAYLLDEEGHYTYEGKFYNSKEDLPLDALKDLVRRLESRNNSYVDYH